MRIFFDSRAVMLLVLKITKDNKPLRGKTIAYGIAITGILFLTYFVMSSIEKQQKRAEIKIQPRAHKNKKKLGR